MRFLACSAFSASVEAMVMVPSPDVDGGAGFFGQRADGGAALADHVTDLLGLIFMVYRRGANWATSVLAPPMASTILPRMCRRASLAWARATCMISLVMPWILMSICRAVTPVVGAGHLEVHVAEVIFVTQDVGQHREAVAVLDQAHGDAATCAFRGTPASISARQPPQTEAIDEEPLTR